MPADPNEIIAYTSGEMLDLLAGETAGASDRRLAQALADGASEAFRLVNAFRFSKTEDATGTGIWTISPLDGWQVAAVQRAEVPKQASTLGTNSSDEPLMIFTTEYHGQPSITRTPLGQDIVRWAAMERNNQNYPRPDIPAVLFYTLTPRPDAEGLMRGIVNTFRSLLRAAAIVKGDLRSHLSEKARVARAQSGARPWESEFGGLVQSHRQRFGSNVAGLPAISDPIIGPRVGVPLFEYGFQFFGANNYFPPQGVKIGGRLLPDGTETT